MRRGRKRSAGGGALAGKRAGEGEREGGVGAGAHRRPPEAAPARDPSIRPLAPGSPGRNCEGLDCEGLDCEGLDCQTNAPPSSPRAGEADAPGPRVGAGGEGGAKVEETKNVRVVIFFF